MRRTAVEVDDGDFLRLRVHRLEQRLGEIGPRRLQHSETLRRKLGTHDIVQLDRKLAPRIEQRVAARLEHALESAVAHQEGALAVLHRDAQYEQVPVHGTSPSLAVPTGDGLIAVSSTWVPDALFPRERRAAG